MTEGTYHFSGQRQWHAMSQLPELIQLIARATSVQGEVSFVSFVAPTGFPLQSFQWVCFSDTLLVANLSTQAS
jgi:hypothetical protein